MREKRVGRSAAALGGWKGGGPRRTGSEGVALVDELSEHFSCSGITPGGLEAQGFGEGTPSIPTGGAAE